MLAGPSNFLLLVFLIHPCCYCLTRAQPSFWISEVYNSFYNFTDAFVEISDGGCGNVTLSNISLELEKQNKETLKISLNDRRTNHKGFLVLSLEDADDATKNILQNIQNETVTLKLTRPGKSNHTGIMDVFKKEKGWSDVISCFRNKSPVNAIVLVGKDPSKGDPNDCPLSPVRLDLLKCRPPFNLTLQFLSHNIDHFPMADHVINFFENNTFIQNFSLANYTTQNKKAIISFPIPRTFNKMSTYMISLQMTTEPSVSLESLYFGAQPDFQVPLNHTFMTYPDKNPAQKVNPVYLQLVPSNSTIFVSCYCEVSSKTYNPFVKVNNTVFRDEKCEEKCNDLISVYPVPNGSPVPTYKSTTSVSTVKSTTSVSTDKGTTSVSTEKSITSVSTDNPTYSISPNGSHPTTVSPTGNGTTFVPTSNGTTFVPTSNGTASVSPGNPTYSISPNGSHPTTVSPTGNGTTFVPTSNGTASVSPGNPTASVSPGNPTYSISPDGSHSTTVSPNDGTTTNTIVYSSHHTETTENSSTENSTTEIEISTPVSNFPKTTTPKPIPIPPLHINEVKVGSLSNSDHWIELKGTKLNETLSSYVLAHNVPNRTSTTTFLLNKLTTNKEGLLYIDSKTPGAGPLLKDLNSKAGLLRLFNNTKAKMDLTFENASLADCIAYQTEGTVLEADLRKLCPHQAVKQITPRELNQSWTIGRCGEGFAVLEPSANQPNKCPSKQCRKPVYMKILHSQIRDRKNFTTDFLSSLVYQLSAEEGCMLSTDFFTHFKPKNSIRSINIYALLTAPNQTKLNALYMCFKSLFPVVLQIDSQNVTVHRCYNSSFIIPKTKVAHAQPSMSRKNQTIAFVVALVVVFVCIVCAIVIYMRYKRKSLLGVLGMARYDADQDDLLVNMEDVGRLDTNFRNPAYSQLSAY